MGDLAGALRWHRLRRRTYEVLEGGATGDSFSRLVHLGLVTLIIVSVGAIILESVPRLGERYWSLFMGIEAVAAAIFIVEYALRLWSSVEHAPFRGLSPWRARMAYARQPAMIVDFVAVLPILLAFILPDDVKVLLIFRLIRFFKLARYSPGMRSLIDAVVEERRALLACLVILCGLMIVAAAAMHMVESTAQPDKFGSIPESMWWAIVTLTTVGYGDAFPITVAGKIVAGVTALFGLVMLALPVGIIATSFAEVIRRREFVVTWAMVTRVPAFQNLEPGDVGEILRVMQSQMAEPGEVIARRGDHGDRMFVIAAGVVERLGTSQRHLMHEGELFGEAAVLSDAAYDTTFRAVERAQLLALSRHDFNVLAEQIPQLRPALEQQALGR